MSAPVVFLSHAGEDDDLAERIGTALQAAGIRTFCDGWSLKAGDSLRARIDQGLGNCTHFVVLLTESSVGKPWVEAEIDAAFVRRVSGKARLIPLRHELSADRLSPLLQAIVSPSISSECFDSDVRNLVNDIFEVTKEPPLGEPPLHVAIPARSVPGFSVAAQSVAKLLAEKSQKGRPRDPNVSVDAVMDALDLGLPDFELAVAELEERRMVTPVRALGCPPLGYHAIEPTSQLFVRFDPVVMGWLPQEDAVQLATDLLNADGGWLRMREVCERDGWTPRRVNPALAVLERKRAVLTSKTIDADFISAGITKNNRTLMFVRRHG